MQHLDEGTIHAWLDGALSADEVGRVELHVASCETCADAVAEARGLIAASSRILTALDEVPRVPGTRVDRRGWGTHSGFPARWRIAAVIAVVAAGGALAWAVRPPSAGTIAMEALQDTQPAAMEVAVSVPEPMPNAERPPAVRDGGRPARGVVGAATGSANARQNARERDLASSAVSETAAPGVSQAEVVAAAAPPPAAPARTDDTVRLHFDVANAARAREEARVPETQSSVAEKVTGALGARRSAADASARFSESAPSQATLRAQAMPAVVRPLTEERMVEDGRVVVRRVYRVEETLVTLDERAPREQEGTLERRAYRERRQAAAAAPSDSLAQGTSTIHWVDSRGAEFTLSGPASREQLERFRKLLGY